METVEVCVVGGGVTGLAAAWRLGLAGRETVLLERFTLTHDRGSSHGATRIFRFAYPDPIYVRMAQAALPLWRELEACSGDEILNVTGGLDVGDAATLDRVARALEGCGATAERLDEPRPRFPWVAVEGPALYSPDTGVLAAARALAAMAGQARVHGVEIRESSPAVALVVGDDAVVVRTEDAEIRARRCVVAAGAWAKALLEPAGVSLPVYVTREQVFYFRSSTEMLPFIDHRPITRYGVPAFAGAAGVKVAEHKTGERTSADGRSFDIDPEAAARVSAYVAETLPDLDTEPVAFETCLYTMTADEDFVIDARGPLIVVSPCSGHGFKFGPLVGEALVCLAAGSDPLLPLERFALKRFG
ncbi:MAG: FAD-dependent oxidoreductase [Actinomycetota bacterium]